MTYRERIEAKANEIELLTDYANSVTGQADANIGDAIKRLVDGYGQGGGGGSVETGTFDAVGGSRFHEVAHSFGRKPDFAILYPIDVTITSAYAITSELILNSMGQLNYLQGGTRTDYEVNNDPFIVIIGTSYALNSYAGSLKLTNDIGGSVEMEDTYVRFGSKSQNAGGGHLEAGTYGYIIGII